MGSRSSSESRAGVRKARRVWGRRGVWLLVATALALGTSACVTVRPEQREILADPAMTFGAGGDAAAHEEHVLSNREGSIGGGGSTGGGCGCN